MPPGVAAVTLRVGAVSRRWQGNSFLVLRACDCHRARKSGNGCTGTICGQKFRFIAPDALLASDEQADWWWSTKPQPYLRRCCINWYRVSSNVVNHYGAGLRRHRTWFLLKFCARFPHLHRFELQQPIAGHRDARWKKWLVRHWFLTIKLHPYTTRQYRHFRI